MPELPEVEFIRRELDPLLRGQSLIAVQGQYQPVEALGQEVVRVERKGKYLMVRFEEGWVVIHLGMTGQVHIDGAERKHTRSRLIFDRDTVSFVDPRGFGSVSWLGEGSKAPGLLGKLGKDPLDSDWTAQEAGAGLTGKGAPIKAVLLDQRAIAGVGNYIADESLWRSKISPRRRNLELDQGVALAQAVREVMAESLERGGVSMRDYQHADGSKGDAQEGLRVYGRAGQECLRCGSQLTKTTLAGRGTTYCPSCQA